MEDKELLELAAKAAGYDVLFRDDGSCKLCSIKDGCTYVQHWNPLTDDGDALRLAVKLELTPYTPQPLVGYNNADCQNHDASVSISEPVMGCPYAATRRAIVQAAAEIGKAMP